MIPCSFWKDCSTCAGRMEGRSEGRKLARKSVMMCRLGAMVGAMGRSRSIGDTSVSRGLLHVKLGILSTKTLPKPGLLFLFRPKQ